MKKFLPLIVLVALMVTGCASDDPKQYPEPPGFTWGLVHGFIVVFAAIGLMFGGDHSIYSSVPTDASYGFGFIIGVIAFLGLCYLFRNTPIGEWVKNIIDEWI